ncbi:tRNA uridine-5-carboxymethylaminomethyl(34) synthesis GTPase MnmE [Acidihalobacter aeolianus]|uniref:tRNA modification GTPase MnmE n=1 Tax=Acidihalobacter aeolianus TaxID=2792603 RepID=A0A1D8KBH9_9GAMM|nr:tRNA uridine-5-carboxymethylaminomethyl(34) synthesis GTPase MnmE [Acidihalobacter aeolianus]AOV18315.1 tRNA uridine-5-carboxymethylaminomethyl(34) synthesis GTPase MnmE [Acidihalobacter aeolianus]
MLAPYARDTIAAVATASGRGAVGIVRVSGPDAFFIAEKLTGRPLPPFRQAALRSCLTENGVVLDQGLLLCFSGPQSFTGEDVVEFQGHGGQQAPLLVWKRFLELGARAAAPGEFSQRAYLNGRLDLAQAEAIADLIDAGSRQAALGAVRSLRGEFSEQVEALRARLTAIRVQVEASVDFVEEDDVDEAAAERMVGELKEILGATRQLLRSAQQGVKLAQGAIVVLAGAPNVGKSSLLNRLAGEDRAIVTPVAGTTRDLLHTDLVVQGMPVQVIDTAGIRDTDDPVEREGVARARRALANADVALLLDTAETPASDQLLVELPASACLLKVRNKIDVSGESPGFDSARNIFAISALTGSGIDILVTEVIRRMGGPGTDETVFTARARQVRALEQCLEALERAHSLAVHATGVELMAEELRQAQEHLGSITGRISADQLLGEIFATFCIGK